MIGNRSVFNLSEPKGATLLNLGRFSAGSFAALDYIPKDTRGFYAWFRSFDYPEDPELFIGRLLDDISAPKFAPRRGFISPYHQVEIASGGDMTQSRKEALKTAIRDPGFYTALRSGLHHSILFQAPLYVGKAFNLRKRISTHLAPFSPLRERLACVGLNLDRCLLLVFPYQTDEDEKELSPSDDEINMNEEIDEELTSQHSLDHEVLLEEVFSRLFSPQFTLRIG